MKNDPFPTDADIVKRLRQIVAEPQKWCSTDVDYVDDAADAIARLTAERDEARRMYCRCRMDLEGVPMGDLNEKGAAFAASRGWDCFKKQTESTDAVDTK
jgi:hypothetical protein